MTSDLQANDSDLPVAPAGWILRPSTLSPNTPAFYVDGAGTALLSANDPMSWDGKLFDRLIEGLGTMDDPYRRDRRIVLAMANHSTDQIDLPGLQAMIASLTVNGYGTALTFRTTEQWEEAEQKFSITNPETKTYNLTGDRTQGVAHFTLITSDYLDEYAWAGNGGWRWPYTSTDCLGLFVHGSTYSADPHATLQQGAFHDETLSSWNTLVVINRDQNNELTETAYPVHNAMKHSAYAGN
jgi:hypothetical protein